MRNLRGLLIFAVATVNTVIWFLPIFFLSLVKLLLPLSFIRKAITRWLVLLGNCWVTCNSFIISANNNINWDVRGIDDLSYKNWYLIITNHQTWVDIVVLQSIFNGRIPFLKFFIKKELFWIPFLGIAWWALDMPFMRRYSRSYVAKHPEKRRIDLAATRRACEKFRDSPTTVINFVEGTRFSQAKRESGGSRYKHLLIPKAGGIALTLSSMGEMFDKIIDVTIVYPEGPISFWDLMCGELDHVIVDIKKRTVETWLYEGDYEHDPNFRKNFHNWLAEIWEEKDKNIRKLLE